MREFRLALGAAVVLITSAEAYIDMLRFEDEQKAEEAERAQLPPPADGEPAVMSATLNFHDPIEAGEITGRAEYLNDAPHGYQVRYRDGTGCHRECWFTDEDLTTPEALTAEYEAEKSKAAGISGDGGGATRGFDQRAESDAAERAAEQ